MSSRVKNSGAAWGPSVTPICQWGVIAGRRWGGVGVPVVALASVVARVVGRLVVSVVAQVVASVGVSAACRW